jgi:calcium-dependent protein kinase
LIDISSDVSDSIKDYIDSVSFKKTTLTYIASRIPEDHIEKLKEAFVKIDKNGDGRLTLLELKEGFDQLECSMDEKDFELTLKLMDTNNNGFIDYTEFIAGCLHSYNYLKEKHLKNAFEYFDKDGSGKITVDELKDCLCGDDLMLDEKNIENLIAEVDINKDGAIDYEEFLVMMKSNSRLAEKL